MFRLDAYFVKMKTTFLIILLGIYAAAKSQIPVEVFASQKRSTLDIMFFKYFKHKNGEQTRWLFFNRNRAAVDHTITHSTHLPQFGFTEAISYNHKNLKGFAPVAVGQIVSRGVYPKAGIQFATIKKDITVFSWLVSEILKSPNLDYFMLFRYTPVITQGIKLFTQVESVNTFPTDVGENYAFTQRLRLGLQLHHTQFGAALDMNQTGNHTFLKTYHFGGFIRQEF
jgi:hypothetical protein